MKRMMKKLRSRAGESIGETLVALLISALALVMLAGAIGAAARMITRSKTAIDNYYAGDAALADPAAGELSVRLTSGDLDCTYNAKYAENNHSGSTKVISYKMQAAGGD